MAHLSPGSSPLPWHRLFMAEADVASPSLGLCPRGERGYEWGVMASRGSLECIGLSPSAHPLCPFPLAVICAYAGLGGRRGPANTSHGYQTGRRKSRSHQVKVRGPLSTGGVKLRATVMGALALGALRKTPRAPASTLGGETPAWAGKLPGASLARLAHLYTETAKGPSLGVAGLFGRKVGPRAAC